jgi:hypothetical protein
LTTRWQQKLLCAQRHRHVIHAGRLVLCNIQNPAIESKSAAPKLYPLARHAVGAAQHRLDGATSSRGLDGLAR